VFLLLSLL